MNRQQIVYALNSKEYYPTSRPSNHPSIVTANERNVHLNFIRCHEVFKGESIFKDPYMEEFYKASRSMPSKSQVFKSSITNVSTNCNEQPLKRLNELNSLAKQRRKQKTLVARSFHFKNQVYNVENPTQTESPEGKNSNPIFEFEETRKIKVPQNIEDFDKFKSQTLIGQANSNELNIKKEVKTIKSLMDGVRLQNSYHLEETPKLERSTKTIHISDSSAALASQPNSSYYLNTPQTPNKKHGSRPSIERELSYETPKHTTETAYTVKLNSITSTTYFMNQPHHNILKQQREDECQIESQPDQISKLKMQLAKRNRELKEYKSSLEMSQKRNKLLQNEVKELKIKNGANIQSNYPNYSYNAHPAHRDGIELCKQFEDQRTAFFYFTLFVVLLAKSTLHN